MGLSIGKRNSRGRVSGGYVKESREDCIRNVKGYEERKRRDCILFGKVDCIKKVKDCVSNGRL